MNTWNCLFTRRKNVAWKHAAFRCIATFALLLVCTFTSAANAGVVVTLLDDEVLDSQALLFDSSATYGRAINGLSFQQEPLLTVGNYQYATWYHLGTSEVDVYLARRQLPGGAWEIMDTGADLTRTFSDAHNVISLGIAGDGTMHMSWDQHCQTMKYKVSIPGAATNPSWRARLFAPERSSLNLGGPTLDSFTYPRFLTDPATGNLHLIHRSGCSGGGDILLATYDASTGLWDTPHEVIDGLDGDVYTDALGSSSTRNAYLNGVNIDDTGRLQVSWTWRESASGANHDILYAYSDDGGDTWNNNVGTPLGTLINLVSPGLYIDDGNPGNGLLGQMDRRNSIMNQQTQAVDLDGRVHVIMWHADDAHRDAASGFNPSVSDYFHYYRDPATGNWTRTELPNDREVGSRPDMAYDTDGNLYVVYVTPGPGDSGGYYTDGDLLIAYATKAAGYTDWQNVYTDTRDFSGEPFIDQQRLLDDGFLSIFIQEHDDAAWYLTGTPLHILEFSVTPLLQWAGDDLGAWDNDVGTDWDTTGDQAGDAAFTPGSSVNFDDGAAIFAVNIANPVAPGLLQFDNVIHPYIFTGAGIGGTSALRIDTGGTITLANGANTYSGDTQINTGTLAIADGATITGSPNITIATSGVLDVSAASGGVYTLDGQTLTMDGNVIGNLEAANNTTVHVNAATTLDGDLTLQAGTAVDGVGRITGNLTAQSGATVSVALNQPSSAVVIYEENFAGNGAPLDGQAPQPIAGGQAWVAHSSIRDDGQNISITSGSSATLPVTIKDGVVYTLELSLRQVVGDTDWFALGYLEGVMNGGVGNDNRFLSDPTTGKAWLLFRGDNSAENNLFILGNDFNGVVDGGPWPTLNTSGGDIDLRIVLNTTGGAGNYTAQYFAKQPAQSTYTLLGGPLDLISENINAVGLAVSQDEVSGNVTHFRLSSEDPTPTPRILTVDSDVTLNTGATLELGLFSPADFDQLSAGGTLSAGGALQVTLDTGAAVPQPGDAFGILAAVSLAGAFDTYVFDAPAAGDLWDLRELYTTGTIAVVSAGDVFENSVSCLTGPDNTLTGNCSAHDQDSDNDNDLHDFAALQDCVLNATGVIPADCLAP